MLDKIKKGVSGKLNCSKTDPLALSLGSNRYRHMTALDLRLVYFIHMTFLFVSFREVIEVNSHEVYVVDYEDNEIILKSESNENHMAVLGQ